jgi:thioredoxin-related protein
MNAWMMENVGEGLIGTPTFIIFNPEGKLVAAQPGIISTDSLETFIKENSN